LRKALYNIFQKSRLRFHYLKNSLFNYLVKKQNSNYKSIPIIIISYNQLSYLRQLIKFLWDHNYRNIVIIDNNSSYPPLLKYLHEIGDRISVYKLKENYGYRVLWKKKELFSKYTKGYYVITDPDIIPIENCPKDFLKYFKKILDQTPQIDKVGFSLQLTNIPDANPNKDKILIWEEKYWQKVDRNGNYIAEIDTTFALYRPGNPFVTYRGIRTKYPYSAYHKGWEIDPANLTSEQKFYYNTANDSASWKRNLN